jgi:hypothetical protein
MAGTRVLGRGGSDRVEEMFSKQKDQETRILVGLMRELYTLVLCSSDWGDPRVIEYKM